MSKTQIWDALAKTDPAHTKKFKRPGGFEGTAIKPVYITRKMTETFGPCGEGWGIGAPVFEVRDAGKETAVYCTVMVWHGSRENVVPGVGGDMIAKETKYGLKADDEAYKKAFTDAVGNALKFLGMSADVHMGLHDDNKYLSQLRRDLDKENGGDAGETTKTEPTPFDADKPDPVAEWANKNWTADKLDVRQMGLPDEKLAGALKSMAAYAPTIQRLDELWALNAAYHGWLSANDEDVFASIKTAFANRKGFFSQQPAQAA